MRHQAIWPVAVVTALVITAGPASDAARAQASSAVGTSTGAQPGENGLVTTGKRIMKWFSQPLHPVVRGVASGGGIGAGLGYTHGDDEDGGWFADTAALITLRSYWSAHVESGYRWRGARAAAFARVRDMKRLNFFGPGVESLRAARTTFRLREQVAGTLGSVPLWRGVQVDWRIEEIWPTLGRGRATPYPSVEDVFAEAEAPGLTAARPRYGHYRAAIAIVYPAGAPATAAPGGHHEIGWSVFADQTRDRWSFRRFNVELQQRLPMPGPRGRLTLHTLVETTSTDTGHEVPFYMQPTLGGNSRVRGFRERLIGSDDTTATLRGFTDLRFRDRNVLLLQAEYRWNVWNDIDATVFIDAGKVARRAADLHPHNLKESYGFSLSYMRGDTALGRIDAGFGGGEGAALFVSVGI